MRHGPAAHPPPRAVWPLRRRVYELLEPGEPGDLPSIVVDWLIVGLIVLNVAAFVLETVQPIRASAPRFFVELERVSIAIFSAEYLFRVWSSTADARYAHPVRGRLRWMSTPLAIADLLAVLPFFLPMLGIDLRAFRAIRIFRLFRLAKMGRYSIAMQTFGRVIRKKKEELLITLMLLIFVLFFASALLYFAENRAQPDAFSSIPAAMWWGIATLTTVGYGDVYPITALGRFLAAIIAVMGIGMFALPTGILGAAFVEEIQSRNQAGSIICPHCGEEIEQPQIEALRQGRVR